MKHILILSMLLPASGFACLNISGTTMDGASLGKGFMASHLRQAMHSDPHEVSVQRKFSMDQIPPEPRDAEFRAVEDIFHGRVEQGLNALLKLEEQSPGYYSIAANIGTAYELMGDNVNALMWIKEGMRRNPDSHDGTEWVHALILEAKIEADKHPGQPAVPRLLDLPEKMDRDFQLKVGDASYTADFIRDSIYYQLQERLVFVKPKDPYVADLLYNLAILEANVGTLESAIEILDLASKYGFADEPSIDRLKQEYRSIIRLALYKTVAKWTAIAFLPVFLLGRHLWRRRHEEWFFWTRRQQEAYLAARARRHA